PGDAAGGAAADDRAGLLRWLDPDGDRRRYGGAGWHGKGAHAHRAAEAAGVIGGGRGRAGVRVLSPGDGPGMDDRAFHEQGFPEAYALDALDGDERRAFAAHLAGCATCRADVAAARAVAAKLPLALDAAEPSPA